MENTELIERFFEGSLSPVERQAFERREAQEPAFTEEVALQRQIRDGLRATGRGRMLSKLEAAEGRMSVYHPPAQVLRFGESTRQRFYWAAAAAVLLLIPVYLWLKANPANERLFAAYFVPYEQHTSQPAAPDPLNHALQQYREKNYAQALPILEQIIDGGSVSDSALFYKANVNMKLGQPQEAIDGLQKIPARSGFHEEAQWYLALAYLQANEPQKTKEIVSEISRKPAHPYQKKAAELARKLK